ncbi:MAG: chemotaxis protein [Paracoccaceae bacterium]|nr:chemotaxis protein [Paracoccaceae bacterium]
MSELDPTLIQEARGSGIGETHFDLRDMLYSRSDERGVILSGNSVFQRVSGYEWEALKGAPHKLIRHDDMPRGLFHLMWETIKSGQPIGFYSKNCDKGGRAYWVFALVVPVEGGYCSVRIKPTSDMLGKISKIYDELLQQEREEELTPHRSAARFIEALRDLGFADYQTFQAAALAKELEARAKGLDVSLNKVQKRFMVMSRAIVQVKRETDELTESFKAIRTVPMNMRIIASRLESAGGPISAISVNYGQMLDEMATWVRTFVDGDDSVFARIRTAILNGQFLTFAAALNTEMVTALEADADHAAEQDSAVDTEILTNSQAAFLDKAVASLGQVETEAARLGRSVLDMKRYVTGLSSTRMMCKIENATLKGSGNALAGIMDQLDACQSEIEERLARIVELNSSIHSNTATLRSMM